MRVEPHGVGSMVHVTKRGARGMPITRDAVDRKRFPRLLYYLNDEFQNENWERDTLAIPPYSRPDHWPERKPLVGVIAWVLMPNHFHLVLNEIQDGGIAHFMQRLCGSMSKHFNARHGEQGSIFQGSYKGKTISNDDYARYVTAYVMVKNVFELYPGGLSCAAKSFGRAWKWGIEQEFSSLPDYVNGTPSPIIHGTMWNMYTPAEFHDCARDMVVSHTEKKFGIILSLFG